MGGMQGVGLEEGPAETEVRTGGMQGRERGEDRYAGVRLLDQRASETPRKHPKKELVIQA